MEQISINFRGIDLGVDFYFQPEEPAVNYYADGSGYPGCAAEVEIQSVWHKGEDITDLVEVYLDEIAEEVLEKIMDV